MCLSPHTPGSLLPHLFSLSGLLAWTPCFLCLGSGAGASGLLRPQAQDQTTVTSTTVYWQKQATGHKPAHIRYVCRGGERVWSTRDTLGPCCPFTKCLIVPYADWSQDFYTQSLTHTHSHAQSHTQSLTHTHTHRLTHGHSHTLTHGHSLTHSHSHTLTCTESHTVTHTHSHT
jgi:hypothetical protein